MPWGHERLVRSQLPLRLGEDAEPLPDIVAVKPRDDHYLRSHPTAGDALLVIEVSSTTLRFDRNVKVPMYARHGVPEIWVLDVGGQQIHRYRSPRDGVYAATSTVPLATRMALHALECEIDLRPLAALLAESNAV